MRYKPSKTPAGRRTQLANAQRKHRSGKKQLVVLVPKYLHAALRGYLLERPDESGQSILLALLEEKFPRISFGAVSKSVSDRRRIERHVYSLDLEKKLRKIAKVMYLELKTYFMSTEQNLFDFDDAWSRRVGPIVEREIAYFLKML